MHASASASYDGRAMKTAANARKGIVLAGGAGTRLQPLTLAASKQLLPVYDKPMIYYPISVLMLADIREILVISTPEDLPAFRRLLGTGENIGVQFTYAEQANPDGIARALIIGADFLGSAPSSLILGDNIFYANNIVNTLVEVSSQTDVPTIFAYHVQDPGRYGVVELDAKGRAISIEEKPAKPKSPYAVPGLYFYPPDVANKAATLKPSARGELEISELNQLYLNEGQLQVRSLGRGIAWFDTGTHVSLLEAANFVAAIQNRQGLQIACLEEIAYGRGWISAAQMEKNIAAMGHSSYAAYLRGLL